MREFVKVLEATRTFRFLELALDVFVCWWLWRFLFAGSPGALWSLLYVVLVVLAIAATRWTYVDFFRLFRPGRVTCPVCRRAGGVDDAGYDASGRLGYCCHRDEVFFWLNDDGSLYRIES